MATELCVRDHRDSMKVAVIHTQPFTWSSLFGLEGLPTLLYLSERATDPASLPAPAFDRRPDDEGLSW